MRKILELQPAFAEGLAVSFSSLSVRPSSPKGKPGPLPPPPLPYSYEPEPPPTHPISLNLAFPLGAFDPPPLPPLDCPPPPENSLLGLISSPACVHF